MAIVEPLKLGAIFIAGSGHWITGLAAIICAYALSLGVVERLFIIVKPKLLTPAVVRGILDLVRRGPRHNFRLAGHGMDARTKTGVEDGTQDQTASFASLDLSGLPPPTRKHSLHPPPRSAAERSGGGGPPRRGGGGGALTRRSLPRFRICLTAAAPSTVLRTVPLPRYRGGG
jgi:hypothetical protein